MLVKRVKLFIFFITVLALTVTSVAQPAISTPDSLVKLYAEAPNDSVKIEALRNMVDFWKTKDFDSCIFYSKQLITKATNNPDRAFKGYFWLINTYGVMGKYDSAISYGYAALKVYGDTSGENNLFQLAGLKMMIGEQYRGYEHFDDAIRFLNESWNDASIENSTRLKSPISNRLAATYYEAKNKPMALMWADTALKYAKLQHNIPRQINTLLIIAAIKRDTGDYQGALENFKKVLEFSEQQEVTSDIPDILNNIATSYSYLNDYQNAIKYAKQSYDITSKEDNKVLSVVSTNILAKSYAGIGDYKNAYKYSQIYEEIRHNLFFKEREKQVSDLTAKYETEQKDRKIAQQKLVLANKNQEIKWKNTYVLFFIILFVLSVIFLIYISLTHRKLKKAHLLLKAQNRQILNHKIETEKYIKKIDDAYRKLKSLEQHRQAMVNMIVHDLKSPLGVLSNIDVFDDEKEKETVIKAISKQMMNLVLNMLDINKTDKEKLKLNKREHSLYNIVSQSIIDMEFFSKAKNISVINGIEQGIVVSADKDVLLRIFVNLLSNAIKFSDSNGNIDFFSTVSESGVLTVSIKDYGIGIDKKYHQIIFEQFKQIENDQGSIIKSTGLGLAFCKMAVEAHGWKITVDSELRKGAEFKIIINDFIIRS